MPTAIPTPSPAHIHSSMPEDANTVSLSARAAKRILAILESEPAGSMLRIAVNGGGCSGFQYAFEITQQSQDDDLVVKRDGAVVLIDSVSLDFVKGSEVDFVDDLIGQSFKIHNPNAVAACGCGTSFSV